MTGIDKGSQAGSAASKASGLHSGFTLAEVLITLGIIGVVAAMTLPALINNKQNKELQVGLEKGYSLISQVLQMMAYGEGQKINYKNYSYQQFAPVFNKYLVSVKACSTNGCLIDRTQDIDEGGNVIGYMLDDYKTYNNKANVEGMYMDNGQFMLRNGMALFIENDNFMIFISVDVNGINKGPNRWGHDLFTFQVQDSGKLLPMGADGTHYEEDDFCSLTSSSKYNGIACTNRALTEKEYWKNLPK